MSAIGFCLSSVPSTSLATTDLGLTSYQDCRYGNRTSFVDYLADPTCAVLEREVINEASLAYEWIMLRLRLKEGFSLSEYRTRFGVDFKEKYGERMAEFVSRGLVTLDEDRVSLTESGFRLSNTILVALMDDEKNC